MADADTTPTSPAPASASAPSAPDVAVPSAPAADAAPVAAPETVQAPVETPAAPAAEAPAASLLGTEPTEPEAPVTPPAEAPKDGEKAPDAVKDGEKPADGDKPAEGEKPAEGDKAPDTAAELPKFEPLTLPDGFQADEKAMGEFTTMLGELELAKGDHVKMQEFGQKAIEMVAAQMQAQSQKVTDYYVSLFNRTKAEEFEALRNDPLIGNGDEKQFETFGKEMANFLQKNGGTKEEVTAFRKYVDERGVANGLPIVRVLQNLKNSIEKYQKEASPIVTGTKPATEKSGPGKGIMTALYGGTRRA